MNRAIILAAMLLLAQACNKEDNNPAQNPSGENNLPASIIEPINRNLGSEKSMAVGSRVFITGFTQLNNNQDAYALMQENGQTVWAKYYDRSPDDTRGEALCSQNNELLIGFSLTGGNADFDATPGAFQMSYGSGGGPKIIYLARINPNTGAVMNATFIGCKLNNGNTNTIRFEDGNANPIRFTSEGFIEVKATKAYDRGDGRLTPNLGPDDDCKVSGGRWIGLFNSQLQLLSGDCLSD